MKYFKFFAIFCAALLVFFIAKGFITPSITYGSEIIVDKPIAEVWGVMNDESKVSLWLEGMTKMEHIGGEKGKVGQVTQYTYNQDGQESIIVETMKSIKKEDHVAMDFVMEDVMTMDYRMDLSTKDGKTIVNSATTTKGIGMLMRSMISFMGGSMQKQEDLNMSRLKKVIEENVTQYGM